jgi:hypothetical protein
MVAHTTVVSVGMHACYYSPSRALTHSAGFWCIFMRAMFLGNSFFFSKARCGVHNVT